MNQIPRAPRAPQPGAEDAQVDGAVPRVSARAARNRVRNGDDHGAGRRKRVQGGDPEVAQAPRARRNRSRTESRGGTGGTTAPARARRAAPAGPDPVSAPDQGGQGGARGHNLAHTAAKVAKLVRDWSGVLALVAVAWVIVHQPAQVTRRQATAADIAAIMGQEPGDPLGLFRPGAVAKVRNALTDPNSPYDTAKINNTGMAVGRRMSDGRWEEILNDGPFPAVKAKVGSRRKTVAPAQAVPQGSVAPDAPASAANHSTDTAVTGG